MSTELCCILHVRQGSWQESLGQDLNSTGAQEQPFLTLLLCPVSGLLNFPGVVSAGVKWLDLTSETFSKLSDSMDLQCRAPWGPVGLFQHAWSLCNLTQCHPWSTALPNSGTLRRLLQPPLQHNPFTVYTNKVK